jgi:MFS family permease
MTTTNTLGHALHMTTAEITWLTASESLTTGAYMLPFGHLADLVGRRLVILISMLLSTALFIAAGFITQPILLCVVLGLIG